MRIPQILIFIGGIIIVAALFYFGKNTAAVKTADISSPMPGAMQATAVASVDFSVILAKAKKIILPKQLDSIEMLELEIKKTRGENDKQLVLNNLAKTWEQTGNILIAGKYYSQQAELTGDTKTLEKAANLFYKGFPTTTDSLAKVFGASEGAKAFATLAKEDSTNLEYSIREAICNIEGLGNIMQGVVLLKGVERKDSTNEEMNLILGRLAVVSGQYDKAIARLEKLTKNHPENAEAWFHLAEAYRATGRKSDAINSLEQCKKLVNDPTFVTQIDNYINQIKNP